MVNLRTFDLNLLRVFEAVSHDRSVSMAADKLGLSQSAVSNALNRLRRELDDPLFVRTRRGMQPTPRAQDLATSIHEALTQIRGGLSAGMAFDPSTAERCFNLLMTDVGEILFLPVLMEKLNKTAPGIDLNIMQSGLQGYEGLLENGLADLAIGRIKLPDTLSSELIHSSPFVVLSSRTNRFLSQGDDGQPFFTFEDFLRAPHVRIEWQGRANNPLGRALGENASRRRIALSIPHTTVLPLIMERTDLVATIPKVFADKLLSNQALCATPPPFPIEQNFVYQWWHPRNDNDPGSRWIRQLFATAGVSISGRDIQSLLY